MSGMRTRDDAAEHVVADQGGAQLRQHLCNHGNHSCQSRSVVLTALAYPVDGGVRLDPRPPAGDKGLER